MPGFVTPDAYSRLLNDPSAQATDQDQGGYHPGLTSPASGGGIDWNPLDLVGRAPELAGNILNWLDSPGGQDTVQQQQERERQAAEQFYRKYRQGDQPAIGGGIGDFFRNITGQPKPQPPHPELPDYGQLNPSQLQDVQKAYGEFRQQQTKGQGGVFQGFPSPLEVGVRTAAQTPLKPIIQKGEEIHQDVRHAWYDSARSGGVTMDDGRPLPPWEQATPGQQAWGSLQGQGPFLKMGTSPLEAPDIAAVSGLGRIGVDAERAKLPYNQLSHDLGEAGAQGFASFGREMAGVQPWEQTRAAYYQGQNLHGSATDPNLGRTTTGATDFGDYAGFFTASELSHAEHYAVGETGRMGDVYRAGRQPQAPLDLLNDSPGRQRLLAVYDQEVKSLPKNGATRDFAREVKLLHVMEQELAGNIEGAEGDVWDFFDHLGLAAQRRAVALDYLGKRESTIPIEADNSFFNDAVKRAGFDAIQTTETNPTTLDPAPVTVYADRPFMTSHRAEVEGALKRGDPVPEQVLRDYPELGQKYGRPVGPVLGKPALAEPALSTTMSSAGKMQLGRVQVQDVHGATGDVIGRVIFDVDSAGVARIHDAQIRGGANSIGIAGVRQLARELLAQNPEIKSFAGGQGSAVPQVAAQRVTGGGLGFMGAGEAQAAGEYIAKIANRLLPAIGEESFGGVVERAQSLAQELRQLPPEAWQGYAGQHIDELSKKLQQQFATNASEQQIERTMLQLGTYERAMRDVVGGRDDPTTPWSDQLANHATEKLGMTEMGQLANMQGPLLKRTEGNLLMRKLQGWETAALNLLDSWQKAAIKNIPTEAERNAAVYQVTPTLAARRPSPLAGPLTRPGEPGVAPPPPGTALAPLPAGTPRRIPDVIQQIMDQEVQTATGQVFHLNEEQAYAAARARGLWPVGGEQGPSPRAPVAGPPPRGMVGLHDVTVSEPPPVEATPRAKEFARAIASLMGRWGLTLVDDRHLLKALRQYYYPLVVTKGPGGETGLEAMESMLNPGRRHPWNPDDPHFHRRIFENLDAAERAGYTVVRDPAIVVPLYGKAIFHAMANQMSLEYLKGAISGRDGRRMLFDQRDRPFDSQHPEMFRDFRELISDDFESGHAWLHPDAANGLRSQLESVVVKNQVGRAFISYQQWDRNVAMWNPLFHGLNLLSHGLMGSMVPLRLAFLGEALGKDPAVVRDIDSWIHAVPARSVWEDEIQVLQGKVPELRDPLSIFGVAPGTLAEARSIPGRVNDVFGRFLWEGMKRSQQRAAFVLYRDKAMRAGFNKDEASAMAGVYADRMVGAQDPRTKLLLERTVAPYTFFAYNWTKTHVMQIFESIPYLGAKILAKEHPELSPEMASWLQGQMLTGTARSLAASFLYTQFLQLTLSGLAGQPHTTFENDQGEKFALDVTPIAQWLGISTGGKRVYLPSPFLRFFDWYRQLWQDVSDRGVGGGTLEFLKNKLMAPIPGVIDQYQHPEWGDLERVRHFVVGGSISSGGIIPMTNQLARIGALQSIQGTAGGDLQGGRLALGIGAMLTGSNPPSYGPRPSAGQAPDPQQEHDAALWLLSNQGISWPHATPAQKLAAIDNVKDSLTGVQNLGQKYQQLEQQAVIEAYTAAGIEDPAGTYRKLVDQGRSPFDELDKLQKADLFAKHPELEAYFQLPSNSPDVQVRTVENQTTGYYAALADRIKVVEQQQLQDDAALRAGTMDEFTWRNNRSQRQALLWDKQGGYAAALAAAYPEALTTLDKSNAFRRAHGNKARVPPAVDVAFQEYQAISLDDKKYALADGSFDTLEWRKDRQAFLNTLPHDIQTRILQFERIGRTPLEQAYQAMVSQYAAFELQHQSAAEAYKAMSQLANNPLARRAYEIRHPQIKTYTMLRTQWFRSHPLAAFWFQGSSGLQRTLQQAGVNPQGNPGQQLNQLLVNPLVDQQLRAAGLDPSVILQEAPGPTRQSLNSAFEPAANSPIAVGPGLLPPGG